MFSFVSVLLESIRISNRIFLVSLIIHVCRAFFGYKSQLLFSGRIVDDYD